MKTLLGLRNIHFPRTIALFRRRSSTMQSVLPIYRLPNELLVHIFWIVANDPTTNSMSLSRITHVCLRWRAAAISAGSLWARIVLTFPILPHHLSYATTCLVRSGAYPLDILLDFRDPAWGWDEDTHRFRWQEMEPIVRLFLSHVERWRKIELLTDTWSPIFTFLWYTRRVESAPLLESVSLARCNAYFASRGQTFSPLSLRQAIPFFGGINLERLHDVSLVGVHIDWKQPSLRNLTHLEFKYHSSDVMPTLRQFQSIAEACPQLISLSIHGWGPIIENNSGAENVRLPFLKLKTLSSGFLDATYAIRLLSLFDMPNLQNLILEDISKVVNPVDAVDATPMLHWLSSNQDSKDGLPPDDLFKFCPIAFPLHLLQSLELHSLRASAGHFISFFRQLVSVTHLSISDISDDVLSLLYARSLSPPHQLLESVQFPILQNLRCQDIEPEVLISIVTSRAYGGLIPPLQEVTLEFFRTAPPAQGSPTDIRLKNSGIEILGKFGSDSEGGIAA